MIRCVNCVQLKKNVFHLKKIILKLKKKQKKIKQNILKQIFTLKEIKHFLLKTKNLHF